MTFMPNTKKNWESSGKTKRYVEMPLLLGRGISFLEYGVLYTVQLGEERNDANKGY